MTPVSQEVSHLLRAWSDGDQEALDRLMPLVYDELRRMAKRHMDRQNPGHTLQTTALIHEAYLRLVNQKEPHWRDRAHFFAVSARAMRHILVDYARARKAAKRGGPAVVVSLDEAAVASDGTMAGMAALGDALETLSGMDRRKCHVVELRYFGGLSVEETAEVLKVSPETVARDWRLARSWLLRELSNSSSVNL
jgi:RNA polymerase sigma-70 factor (ECF subfamily)